MTSPLLFEDASVELDRLRRHSHLRWGSVPPGVIPLTAAEPDFPAAAEVREAVQRHAADGLFHYGHPTGDPELLEVISQALAERHGVRCRPDRILPAPGTAAAIWMVVHLTCQPGDEAILLDPVDLLFGMALDAANVVRRYWKVDKDTTEVDLDALRAMISPRTRLICLCNPHNPLGKCFTEPELRAIAEVAEEHDLIIMADEIWSEIVYSPHRHISIASLDSRLAQRCLTLLGPSKTFGLPGLRIGFIATPNETLYQGLVQVAARLGQAYSVSSVAQVAALTAYRDCWYWRDAFVDHLRQTRDYAVERLVQIPGVRCNTPESTYALFPAIDQLGLSSREVADYLLEAAKVAVVPGTTEWFGPSAEGNIRLCFSTAMSLLRESLDRVEEALRSLPRG